MRRFISGETGMAFPRIVLVLAELAGGGTAAATLALANGAR
jgi:hypothetical protein